MLTTPQQLFDALNKLTSDENAVNVEKYRYVIYARKSTDDGDKQVRSLSDQVVECKEYAALNNLNVVAIIQEKESAKVSDIRPRFRELLDKVKQGKYHGILSWHPDRLARNMKDAGEIIDFVDRSIIKDLRFVSFNFDNTTSGKMLLGITFVLSKQYSDHLSDSVSRGNTRSLKEGKYINKAKPGYFKDTESLLRPDEANFILIKNMFQMRLAGETLDNIAAYLIDNGYTSAKRKTPKITKQWVSDVLSDPVYCGVLVYGKQVINLISIYDFIPAVSVDDFMNINKLSSNSQILKLAKAHRNPEEIRANLLRGIVICANCQEPMSSGITSKKSKVSGKKTLYFYYRCETKGCHRCDKSVRAKILIDYVCDYLSEKPFSSEQSYKHYTEEMKRVSATRISEAQSTLKSLLVKKQRHEDKLTNIKNTLSTETDEEIKESYRSDFKTTQNEIIALEESVSKTKTIIDNGKVSILAHAEFLELMNKLPKTLRKIKNMKDLDYIIKKIFSNFTVSGNNVVNSTLNSPFSELVTSKVLNGGRKHTTLELFETATFNLEMVQEFNRSLAEFLSEEIRLPLVEIRL